MTAIAERPVEPVVAPPERRKHRADWLFPALIPTLLTWWHAAYYGPWIVDDAGLTFAYARSLATGAGPVLQPGADPVEGFSNPAWLAILTMGRWLGLFDRGALLGQPDIIIFPKAVALLCCFGIFVAMFVTAKLVTRHPALVTLAAGSFTAAIPSFVIWTTSGLENALFALTVVALAATLARAAARDRTAATPTAVTAGALAALAALTRPDGMVYVLAYPLAATLIARSGQRRAAAAALSIATFCVPVGGYLLWRVVTFGDYLSNPARAKAQGLPGFTDLARPAELVGYAGWLTVGLAVAAIAIASTRGGTTRVVLAALAIPLYLAIVGFAVLRADWMAQYRFATPVWPLAALITALATAEVLEDASLRQRAAACTAGSVAIALSLAGFSAAAREFRAAPTVGVCNIALNTGYAVNGYADILKVKDGSLLAVDGGGSSLTTRLRFVDLSGLADGPIARYWQRNHLAGLRDHILNDVRPTFVRLFTGWDQHARLALADDPRFARDYLPLLEAGPGGGEWVRRDAVADPAALDTARAWGLAARRGIEGLYTTVPVRWHCGDLLRPTPYGDGEAAAPWLRWKDARPGV